MFAVIVPLPVPALKRALLTEAEVVHTDDSEPKWRHILILVQFWFKVSLLLSG